ncbi:EamA family transporter [Acinetobacter qingfengensis]|uniref:Transporter n=1 Tax=Acinetobacter qingfengensis TaxID=1262585 RepID=A0A1E7QXH9_9GAMM|nr:EamA family transporter [Acinetobacter qingfengensis]KAA8731670.1 EamA family transporter [Acinetobacter qingfengensis]OEY91772.1 transporter [Acinetobacter qingfengensis]
MFSSQLGAMLCMLISMLSYQFSASYAKHLFEVLDPTSVTVLRLSFAFLIIFFMLRSWRIWKKLAFVQWQIILCYSLALGLMNICFYHALNDLPQGIAVGLEFIGPLGLALLSVKQRSDFIWVGCAILGIVLLMPWTGYQRLSWRGVGFALSAGFCWAMYIYFGQKVIRQNIGIHSLTLGIGLAALCLLPYGLWQNSAGILNTMYWKNALILALLATAIPYALDLYALKSLNRLSYGTFTSLSPAMAAIVGMLVLDEYLSLIQWVALFSIMLASIGITLRSYRQRKKLGA